MLILFELAQASSVGAQRDRLFNGNVQPKFAYRFHKGHCDAKRLPLAEELAKLSAAELISKDQFC